MGHGVRYERLPTEQRNPRSRRLDLLSTLALLRLMHREDARAVRAIQRQLPQIATAVRLISRALQDGGRLFFVGAGTSGRLGVIEAAECPPTFHTRPSLVQAVIAGGRGAVFRSREGAEDDRAAGRRAVRQRLRAGDVVVGIAASGVTPFVAGALFDAPRRGARTILITSHPRARVRAQVRIVLAVGPEILTGSTRLKAGTAAKLTLNMLTLGAMVRLGKTYGNLMVDVRPTSHKLRARAVGLIRSLTGVPDRNAQRLLRAAHGRVKAAVLMHKRRLTFHQANHQLNRSHGSLRLALRRG